MPKGFITSIPRSTTQSWKSINPEAFIGYEFAHQVETDLEQVKIILDERVKRMKNMFYAFCRIYITILNFNEIHANPKLANVIPVLNTINKERLASNRAFCCKEI